MTDEELRAISDRWSEFPIVGHMRDGAEIRNISNTPDGRNFYVREPSGYFCSPIAYSCRDAEARRWFTPKWARSNG